MTQVLSANTLEAVRRNMTVMSFMIIVFFFAGGQIPETGVVIKLPLSNVEFTKPERLLYVLWIMMAWWTYRYFALGAWSGFKKDFSGEAPNRIYSSKIRWLVSWLLPDVSINHATQLNINLDTNIVNLTANGSKIKEAEDYFSKRVLCIYIAATRPSFATFILPIIMLEFAFILTVIVS